MDYELVIDLTDANTQAFATTIQSLLLQIIPSFDIHKREKYFTSIKLKCNLNTTSLPDSAVIPTLEDLNNTKPIHLGGGLIKFENVERPKMELLLKQQKRRNMQHKQRLNNNFMPQNRKQNEIETEHKALAAVLPSPTHPLTPTTRTRTKRLDPPKHPSHTPIIRTKRVRLDPPDYHEVSPPPEPVILPNDDEKKIEIQNHSDEQLAKRLQETYNGNQDTKLFPTGYGLSDAQWRQEHAKLQNGQKQGDQSSYTVDEDYALALRLQQELENADDDMKMAMELQKEEEIRAKVDHARNRYRNANFVDWGQRPGDSDHNIDGIVRQLHRWRPTPNEIVMNNDGSMPPVFGRLYNGDEDEFEGDDDMNEEAILNAFSHHASVDELYGLHDVRMRVLSELRPGRRRRVDDSWQRLPVRTLTSKDVEILSKTEEKKSCAICMNDFKTNDITRQLPCFHEFHKDCVDKWFQQQNHKGNDASCPLDRKKVKANTMDNDHHNV